MDGEGMTPEALYAKGLEHKGENAPAKAADCFKISSKSGHIPSIRELGLMYLKGDGIEKDLSKAYDLLSEASGSMDPESTYSLALMYEKGWGVEQDLYEALRLFAFSANMNFAEAEIDADRVEDMIRSERNRRLRSRPILNLDISDVDIEAACCKELLDNAIDETIYVIDTYQGPEMVSEDESGFEIIHGKCPFCGKKIRRVKRNREY